MDRIKKLGFWIARKPLRPASLLGNRYGGAPPAVLGFRAVAVGSNSSGTTVNLPTRSAGDTLVAFVGIGAPDAIAANTGWTRRHAQAATDNNTSLQVYTRQSNGTDNTPLGGTAGAGFAYAVYSIQNPVTGFDVSGIGTNPGMPDSSVVAPDVTATGDKGVLLSCFMRCVDNGTITGPGGQTLTAVQNVTSFLRLIAGYELLNASGPTGTRTATMGDSTAWIGCNVVVK